MTTTGVAEPLLILNSLLAGVGCRAGGRRPARPAARARGRPGVSHHSWRAWSRRGEGHSQVPRTTSHGRPPPAGGSGAISTVTWGRVRQRSHASASAVTMRCRAATADSTGIAAAALRAAARRPSRARHGARDGPDGAAGRPGAPAVAGDAERHPGLHRAVLSAVRRTASATSRRSASASCANASRSAPFAGRDRTGSADHA